MEKELESIRRLRKRLERLWKQIQAAPWEEKSALRLEYHVAYEVYRRQKIIAEHDVSLKPVAEERDLMDALEENTSDKAG